MSKHTPGPWRSGGCVVWKDGGSMICDLAIPGSKAMPDEIEANARLIAAAPELLEALEEIERWESHSIELSMNFGSNGVRDFYRHKARAAIAKAKGEA